MYIDKDGASLAALDITNESHIFLWDGCQVGGDAFLTGEANEPLQLLVTYPVDLVAGDGGEREEEVAMGFPKSSTLGEVRVSIILKGSGYLESSSFPLSPFVFTFAMGVYVSFKTY